MRNNQLAAVFLGLFFLSTLANAYLIYRYNSTFKQIPRLQSGVRFINVLQSLVNESAEYGKTHPDMARLLQSIAPAPAAKTAAPANTKPATNK
jgi:hypothetical protein